MTYPSRIIGWPRFIHPGWKIMLDAGRFPPEIEAPVASDVWISGIFLPGETLTASYNYLGARPENGSIYQWYFADTALGVGKTAILGATQLTYEVQPSDMDRFVLFGVTPSDGIEDGSEALVVAGPDGINLGVLFQDDEGGFLNTFAFNTLFTDTAGTTPVTAIGDTIALGLDQSGNNNDMVQATAAERPVYGQMPVSGVRNLIRARSDDRPWTYGYLRGNSANGTITTSEGFDTLVRTSGPWGRGFHALDAALPVGTYITLTMDVRWSAGSGAIALSPSGSGGLSDVEIEIPSVSSEWQPLRVTVVTTSTADQALALTLGEDGTSVDARNIQVEYSAEPTAYQSVVSAYNVTQSGTLSVPIAYLDTSDDNFSWTLPAGTYHLFIAGDLGCYFDTVVHAGGEFTVGPTSWTGGPAGAITTLIGQQHVIMPVIRDEAFTQSEKELMVAYVMARGGGEVWNTGSELFSGSITVGADWVDNGGGSYTKTGSSGTADGIIATANSVPVGALIDCERTVIGRTAGSSRILTNTGSNVTANSTSNGRMREIGLVTVSGPLAMGGTTPFDGTVTGISLKQLTQSSTPT